MRLFIAINLPEKTKNVIEEAVNKIKPLFDNYSAHFSPKNNWHLTITFLGYQPPEALDSILKSIKETAAQFTHVKIDFESISYGPPGKPARMVWLTGVKKTSEKLNELKIKLDETLIENGIKFKQDNRRFNAHLTLVRFPDPLGKLPDKLITPLSLSFEAETLDLMESHLKQTGAEYEVLSEFDFH
ncbi:MAG: RNA 2',3'-cyclic phosphodiesterase [bacterium]|nr:RNA 2',3'-cyclic phosphodiesterase [bacterium]